MQENEKCISAILKNLQVCESYEDQGEKTRQEVKNLLDELDKYAGKVRAYYRQKYELDKPPAARIELGRKICELREQGLEPNEIMKRLGVKRGSYYYLIAEYNQWGRK